MLGPAEGRYVARYQRIWPLSDLLDHLGQPILTAMQDLAGEDEVVEPGHLHDEVRLLLGPQQLSHPFLHDHGDVAQPHRLDAAVAQHGFGDHAGGVGEVQQPGVGAEALHVGGDGQGDGDGAAGIGKAAEAVGLLTDQTIFQRDALIADPGLQTTGAELRADIIGSCQRGFAIQGLLDPHRESGFGQHATSQSGDDLHLLAPLLNIDQPQLPQRQFVLPLDEPFDQLRCVTGAGADDRYLES